MNAVRTSRFAPRIYSAVLAVLLLIAMFSIVRSASRVLSPLGGIDGHAYWYSGHFIRQGKDPYGASRTGEQPSVPVSYLDGLRTETSPVAQQGLSRTPANSPAMVLLLTPLAFFSWPTVKVALFLVNLALMLVIPLLTVRLLPQAPRRYLVVIVCLLFYGMQGTRVAVWTLQTTLLVLALMLLALLALNQHWLLSGLLLGLALSKISFSIPIFLFVAYRRRYRVLAVSLLVQLAGLMLVSLIGQRSPIDVALDYWAVLVRHIDLPGVHLASLFANQPTLTLPILVGGSAIVFGLLVRWLPAVQGRRLSGSRLTFMEYHGLVALMMWTLLSLYHRVYDTVAVILAVALLSFGLAKERGWKLPKTNNRLVFIFLIALLFVMMLPGTVAGIVLSDQMLEVWLRLVNNTMTLMLLLSLAVTLILLRRLRSGESSSLSTPEKTLGRIEG